MAEPRKRFATAKEFREYYEALKKAGKLGEAEVLADQETFPNNEIRARTAQFRDAMRKNLGWDLNANGTIPQDKNGKSRMFLVRRATWGEEVLEYDGKKLSDGTPLKFGSREKQPGSRKTR